MQSYGVEAKALIGNSEKADQVRSALTKIDPGCKLELQSDEHTNYFVGGTLKRFVEVIAPHISGFTEIKLDDLVERAKDFSVSTRDKNGTIYFAVKATVTPDLTAGGPTRIEVEEKMPMSLEELDKLVLSAGFQYQAKWARKREQYFVSGVGVTLDNNDGYGWLAEFERVVDDEANVEKARGELKTLMQELGVEEVPQSRLERMFQFYESHWQEYYESDKIFSIE